MLTLNQGQVDKLMEDSHRQQMEATRKTSMTRDDATVAAYGDHPIGWDDDIDEGNH